MKKFDEAQLERMIIDLLDPEKDGIGYEPCYAQISDPREGIGEREGLVDITEVLLENDLKQYLEAVYPLTNSEIDRFIIDLKSIPENAVYDSNKNFSKMLEGGLKFLRDDRNKDPIYIDLISAEHITKSKLRVVSQLEIQGKESLRRPDAIIYINGLPLVVMEFKSAIKENATLADAHAQITKRYMRDIPKLFVYNVFCVISDGINTKMGSCFASYEFYYGWRKIQGDENVEKNGVDSLTSLIEGVLKPQRLVKVARDYIYFPDNPRGNEKIVPRYPQFFAAEKMLLSIVEHMKSDHKGGVYFGATGSGKSFAMLFLTRLLMKSTLLENPTVVLITDRNDLDDQLSKQFLNSKNYLIEENVTRFDSRDDLKQNLDGVQSGGIFLTTIQKFEESDDALSLRNNIICISDEAHRSQTDIEGKVDPETGQKKKPFGYILRHALPNATYVGFSGTPIPSTLQVFGEVVDRYTMIESVRDGITVEIKMEGRAAKVVLDNAKLKEIEEYYSQAADDGANEHQIDRSKKEMAKMTQILGDSKVLDKIAADFAQHYQSRISEGATSGKAMFVVPSRMIGYQLYERILKLEPGWGEVKAFNPSSDAPSERELESLTPVAYLNMVMTRNKDDDPSVYRLLGSKEDRQKLDLLFKNEKSNFRIAIVRDMWLTGYDVPELDTIYVYKPIQGHTLIQTLSRVNRRYKGKEFGLVVDYIGLSKRVAEAMAEFGNDIRGDSFEDVKVAVGTVRDTLEVLGRNFSGCDMNGYFQNDNKERLDCLNNAAEFIQASADSERRFLNLERRLHVAYQICCGANELLEDEQDLVHFYFAVRSILYKLTKGEAPDADRMNTAVSKLIEDALDSDGVIAVTGSGEVKFLDIFDPNYLDMIKQIKMPLRKIDVLLLLLKRKIAEFGRINRIKGVEFSKKFEELVKQYNSRGENIKFVGAVIDEFTKQIFDLIDRIKEEQSSFNELGITYEEKAFYDILVFLCSKYHFSYPEEKMHLLSSRVLEEVEKTEKYTAWEFRQDIRSTLKFELVKIFKEFNYPPIVDHRDEVFKEIFKQALNFKKNYDQ